MAENSTIARPYAQAAFDIANEKSDLKSWSDMLQLVAAVTSDAVMSDMISNPSIEREKIVEIIVDVCGNNLNDLAKNFVKVLAENGRLNVAEEIALGFEEHRAEAEKTVEAEVTSAFPLSDAQVNSKVAHWQINMNTGLRRWFWDCDLVGKQSGDECL